MQTEENQLRDRILSTLAVAPEARRVSVELYRQLAAGSPVALDDVADALTIPVPQAKEDLAKATLSDMEYDEAGRVVAFGGLTLKPTTHCFQVEDRALHTWCAFDTLFLPRVLNKRAKVESTCPVSGHKVHLSVTPNRVEECMPETAVVSLVAPEAEHIEEKIKTSFCCHVHFFASEEAASTWLSAHNDAVVVPVVEAFLLARAVADALILPPSRKANS